MRTTPTTFATALAVIGMLGIGSLTTMGQDAGDQPPSNAPPAQPSTSGDLDASADNQAATPDTPEPPAAPGDEATSSGAPGDEAAADAARQDSPDANQGDQNQNANRTNQSQDEMSQDEMMPSDDAQSTDATEDRADDQQQARDQSQQSDQVDAERFGQSQQSDTPPVPEQAREANRSQDANIDRNADWRTTRYNDEWWYYAPSGQWNYYRNGQWQTYQADRFQRRGMQDRAFAQGESWSQGYGQQQPYSTGYRGEGSAAYSDQGYVTDQGTAPQLRYDRCGRAYICENGRKVYVDVTSTHSSTSATYSGEQSVYQDSPTSAGPPAVPQDPSQRSMSGSATGGTQTYNQGSTSDADVGRPTPAREDLRVAPPAPPQATP